MDVLRSLDEASRAEGLRGCAVAIGNFDGVHLGHQQLIRRALELAHARGARGAVLTFDPHPVRVLRPSVAPPVLTSLPRKLEILARLGVDAAVVQPFDREYASSPAERFVARDLAERLRAAEVVVGWDFTAGHDRARVAALRPLMERHGIALHVVEPVTSEGLVVSSTKIREFLLQGKVEAAAELLTRPYDVDGEVVRGAGRGRGFGFATANVGTDALLPANGVYVVRAFLGAERRPYGGVCNVGVKPTVAPGGGVTAEVHLFDHDGGDLYGEPIRVAFLARLRDERLFPSIDALRAQIARDAEAARAALAASGM
ncbi:MAG TPA: bifunctional riboflavin kinase/FAD synthetase [Anaeromyxobacteraceae bacterium]|nr:bifunctional riboflavin kinase/FAD synthetase [Anaeromyxobacteraceae bacterium]